MPFGVLTGLGAALAWGTLDVITALVSRVVGSLRVTAGMQLVTALIFAGLVILTGTVLPTDPRSIAIAALLGLIGAGAYLAYFTGLQFGPISVVSGVVAAFGGLTVVLAVAFRGETLTPLQAAGATLATAGVILTGVSFEGGVSGARFAGPGVAFSVVALVLFSAMTITTDIALETMSWIQIYAIARTVNASIGIGALVVLGAAGHRLVARPDGGPTWPRARVVAAIAVAGILDVLGLISFAIGLETAPTWMVGLASSLGPALTILVAVSLLGERLRRVQWLGLAAILAGMVAIAIP